MIVQDKTKTWYLVRVFNSKGYWVADPVSGETIFIPKTEVIAKEDSNG